MTRNTDASQLAPLVEAGYQLIPLHNFAFQDEHKGKRRMRGKSPIHGNWTKKPYRSTDQVTHMEAGDNVGVRLSASDLVIDVDPRAFPDGETLATDNPFSRLCEAVGFDPDEYPTVETGGGGLHVYMTNGTERSVRDSLPDYPGVEFKAVGCQVVAPGSIHPDTLNAYAWLTGRPLDDLWLGASAAPGLLITLIERPKGSAPAGGGEHDQEELAQMLDRLDPENCRDHETWLTLMQACHHATAGDGREEFVEWCTRDPAYSDHGGVVGLRWDSLHADNEGGRVTYKTLHKIVRDAGQGDHIPQPPAPNDFDDLDPDDLPARGSVGVRKASSRG